MPNKVLILHKDGDNPFLSSKLSVLGTLKEVDEKATAYYCENYTCKLPMTSSDDLRKILRENQDWVVAKMRSRAQASVPRCSVAQIQTPLTANYRYRYMTERYNEAMGKHTQRPSSRGLVRTCGPMKRLSAYDSWMSKWKRFVLIVTKINYCFLIQMRVPCLNCILFCFPLSRLVKDAVQSHLRMCTKEPSF